MDTLNPFAPDFLTFDVENSAELPTMFAIDATTGVFEFTPTNSEVGVYLVNVTTTDGTETTSKEVTFDIGNMNDDPVLEYVLVGGNPVTIVDHKTILSGPMSAFEDELFNFTVTAVDVDIGDRLIFRVESGPPDLTMEDWGDHRANFSFTPTNADAIKGSILLNISVQDGGLTADDFVIIDINVINRNEPPEAGDVVIIINDNPYATDEERKTVGFNVKNSSDPDGDALSYQWDFDIHRNLDQIGGSDDDNELIGIENIFHQYPYYGNYTGMLTITDSHGAKTRIKFNVSIEPAIQPPDTNKAPSIYVSTRNGLLYYLGEEIQIDGSISDPDGDDVIVMVEVVFPDGYQSDYYSDPGTMHMDSIYYSGDGSWTYYYQTETLELGGILEDLIRDLYIGEWTFYFIAEDEHGARSDPVNIFVSVQKEEEDPGPKPGDDPFSLGFFAFDILVFIVLFIIILIFFAAFLSIRDPLREREKLEYSGPPPPPPPPPAAKIHRPKTKDQFQTDEEYTPYREVPEGTGDVQFLSCPACSSWIPAYVVNCPGCGYLVNEPEIDLEAAPDTSSEIDWEFEPPNKQAEADIVEVIPPDTTGAPTDIQPLMDICPNCGEEVATDDIMCRNCDHYFDVTK
jgi:hypothetical protein